MKKLYWRPSRVPRLILLIIALIAIGGMGAVEMFQVKKRQPYYRKKIKAAMIMKSGMEVLRQYRIRTVGPIDRDIDPANSGLIGRPASPITSTDGYLKSKQTSVNPNWAAVMVQLMKRAGVQEGDVVAMGFSGSFPAINLAALAAAEALKVRVAAVSSVSGSTWGANIPAFTWLDMERVLHEKGIISHRSVAASLGGNADRALGMSQKAHVLLHSAIKRNKVRFIQVEKVKDSIVTRMAIYRETAGDDPIAAYVNIGGSKISVGSKSAKRLYQPGLNRRPSAIAMKVDSVMTRFAREGVPIIHMLMINNLAEKYGLPIRPEVIPGVGEGLIFEKMEYSFYLTGGVFVLLIALLYLFLKSDIGYRIFGSTKSSQVPKHPEPMI